MAATRILTPRALSRACAAQSPFTALASQGPRAAQAIRNAQASQVSQLTARRWKSGPFGYTQAKALVYSTYGEPKDVISLHNHSISPTLPANTALLRALAVPLNPADINQIQGLYPSKPPLTLNLGTSQPSAVAGNEGCFEVVSLGPSQPSSSPSSTSSKSSPVTPIQKGDWVIMSHTNFGTYRTHALAPLSQLLKIENPAGLTPIQVGTVSVNPCTAYRMLRDFSSLSPGDFFIQNGANSGVGRAAIQLGRLWGYKSINVIRERDTEAATEELRSELLSLGATYVVTEADLMDRSFSTFLREATAGAKVKLGLNCVGGRPASAMARALSNGATMVTYGGMSKQPLQLATGLLIFKDIRFKGFWVSRWSDEHPDEKRRMVGELLDLMRSGELKDVPVERIEWEWSTPGEALVEKVQGTLEGKRSGKGVFVFKDT